MAEEFGMELLFDHGSIDECAMEIETDDGVEEEPLVEEAEIPVMRREEMPLLEEEEIPVPQRMRREVEFHAIVDTNNLIGVYDNDNNWINFMNNTTVWRRTEDPNILREI